MDEAGDHLDAAPEEQIQTIVKQVGPEFEAAWNLGDDLDEDSPDAAAYNAALEELSGKCN